MTKNLVKTFLIIFALVAAIIVNSAFAGEVKSTESKSSTVNANEDPDLKLSIEELKKKYPIDWLEKKYGDSNHIFCGDSDGSFEYDGEVPENLVCTFNGPNPKEKKKLEDFSFNEIRSAFVNIETYNKDTWIGNDDERLWDLIGITLKFFEEKPSNKLSEKEKSLKKFILSDKIMMQVQGSLNCYRIRIFSLKTPLNCKTF